MERDLRETAFRADAYGMTQSEAALVDLERCLSALVSDPAARESIMLAAEHYGDARADEALAQR